MPDDKIVGLSSRSTLKGSAPRNDRSYGRDIESPALFFISFGRLGEWW